MRPLPLQLRIRVSFTSSLFGDILTTMADPGTYTRGEELDAPEAYIPNHTSMTGCLFGTTLHVGFSFSST
jgi:hypothetical protein